jgi:exodeoxyribonuclease VII large subunit
LSAEKIITAMNPDRNLRLGYSIILDARGKVVTSSRAVCPGDAVKARLADGTINARVEK